MRANPTYAWIVVLAVSVVSQSCGKLNVWGRRKQIDSYSRVSTIARLLENRRAQSSGILSESDVNAAVTSIGNGLDAWGHEIRVFSESDGKASTFVVVSPGRDGKLEFEDPEPYFASSRVDIRGLLDRDIVFRDGQCVTNAGKGPHSGFPPPS